MTKSKAYHHGNLKAELVQAALGILDAEGVDAVGIRQVARKVGVAHSAPANHFKNKQSLLTALVEEIFRSLLQTIESRFTDSLSIKSSIMIFCQSILDFALSYPNRYRLMWRQDVLDLQDENLRQSMETIYQTLTASLKPQASIKRVDVESQAIAVWSLIHGYVSLRLDGNLQAGRDAITGQERLEAIVDVLLAGIA